MIPEEVKAIARAVLQDDEAAAYAMLDCLMEARETHPPDKMKALLVQLYQEVPKAVRVPIQRLSRKLKIDNMETLLAHSARDLDDVKGVGKRTVRWLEKWLSEHGLKLSSVGFKGHGRQLPQYEVIAQQPDAKKTGWGVTEWLWKVFMK